MQEGLSCCHGRLEGAAQTARRSCRAACGEERPARRGVARRTAYAILWPRHCHVRVAQGRGGGGGFCACAIVGAAAVGAALPPNGFTDGPASLAPPAPARFSRLPAARTWRAGSGAGRVRGTRAAGRAALVERPLAALLLPVIVWSAIVCICHTLCFKLCL